MLVREMITMDFLKAQRLLQFIHAEKGNHIEDMDEETRALQYIWRSLKKESK